MILFKEVLLSYNILLSHGLLEVLVVTVIKFRNVSAVTLCELISFIALKVAFSNRIKECEMNIPVYLTCGPIEFQQPCKLCASE